MDQSSGRTGAGPCIDENTITISQDILHLQRKCKLDCLTLTKD